MLVPLEPPRRDVRFATDKTKAQNVFGYWKSYKQDLKDFERAIADVVLRLNIYRQRVHNDPEAESIWQEFKQKVLPALDSIKRLEQPIESKFYEWLTSNNNVHFAQDRWTSLQASQEALKYLKEVRKKVLSLQKFCDKLKEEFPKLHKKNFENLNDFLGMLDIEISWVERYIKSHS